MMRIRKFLALLCLLAAAPLLAAADPVLEAAERHARLQTQGLPGKVSITVGSLSPSTQLPPCSAHEAYTPPGARLWGKTSVGVRCLGPNVWSVLVPVRIAVSGDYVVTARALAAGQIIRPADLVTQSGDLSALPAGIVTDGAVAVGKSLKNSLGAGQPLRSDQLLAPLVIRQGQSVKLTSSGPGFAVSGEGKAINNAAAGQVAQVRTPSGQVVSGIAQDDGTVEISF